MFPRSRPLPILVALGLVALAVSACGRRGSLEPPPGPAAAQRAPSPVLGARPAAANPVQDGDEVSQATVPGSGIDTPLTTTRGAKRGYTIPKDPFILDPLL